MNYDQKRLDQSMELQEAGRLYVLRRFPMLRADVDDILQDVTLKLIGAERDVPKLQSYFFACLKNRAIDHIRSRASKPRVSLSALTDGDNEAECLSSVRPEPEQIAETKAEDREISRAVAAMRPNYREAFMLRQLGFTVPEIAERLGLSLSAAKKLVLRSSRQFKQRLQQQRTTVTSA